MDDVAGMHTIRIRRLCVADEAWGDGSAVGGQLGALSDPIGGSEDRATDAGTASEPLVRRVHDRLGLARRDVPNVVRNRHGQDSREPVLRVFLSGDRSRTRGIPLAERSDEFENLAGDRVGRQWSENLGKCVFGGG